MNPFSAANARPRFLFVTDQGRVFSCHEEPSPTELACATVGILTIVRLADLHRYAANQTWIPVLQRRSPGHEGA